MLKNLIKFGIYLSLLTPLIVTKSTFYPFIFGKAIYFQILVEVLFILWLFTKPKLKWSRINIALLIYFSVLFITTIFSLDFLRSFWSTQERMTGFFNLAHFGLFFLIISSTLNKKDFINLFRFSLFVSVIVSVWSLISWAPRLAGPLGNPGFLAQYLLFNLFFAIYLFLDDKKTYWRIGYVLVFLLNFIAFYLTYTRGALLGFFVGILALIFVLFWSTKRLIAIVLLFTVLAAGFSVFWLNKERFSQATESRIISWGISWSAFKEKPILGWGSENYILAFAKHYNPEIIEHEKKWLDKAHNIIFEYMVTTGILGLAAYLLIISFSFSPIIIAYFITNLFWLEMTSGLILFYIVLAWVERGRLEEKKNEPYSEVAGQN